MSKELQDLIKQEGGLTLALKSGESCFIGTNIKITAVKENRCSKKYWCLKIVAPDDTPILTKRYLDSKIRKANLEKMEDDVNQLHM